MKFTLNIIIILFTFFHPVKAQDKNWTLYPKKKLELNTKNDSVNSVKKELDYNAPDGKIKIYQTSSIDTIQEELASAPFIYGYTVQIEVSQQKEIIKKARYRFLKSYPDMPLDEYYNQPNTYLYGGRFYDKNTAYEFKQNLTQYFPDAIVIRKKMDLPPLSKKDDSE